MSFNNFILGGAPIASMPLSFTVAETYSQILEASRNQATSWWVNNRPLDIFIPPIDPSIGLQRKREFKILEASFGDGYSQLSASGTNYIREILELSWDVLTSSQSQVITNFLESKGGIKTFVYLSPDALDVMKFTCSDWTETYNRAGYISLKATFRQSFNLSF